MMRVFAFLAIAVPISGGMAVTPKRGQEPVKWTHQTSTPTSPRWDATLSAVEGGCARLDVMAGTGAVETVIATCNAKSPGRIQIEPVQIDGNQVLVARVEHGDRKASSLVMLAFLCNRIVRLDLGDDAARTGPQYGDFPGALPRFDRFITVSGSTINVYGGKENQRFVVEGCSIDPAPLTP